MDTTIKSLTHKPEFQVLWGLWALPTLFFSDATVSYRKGKGKHEKGVGTREVGPRSPGFGRHMFPIMTEMANVVIWRREKSVMTLRKERASYRVFKF